MAPRYHYYYLQFTNIRFTRSGGCSKKAQQIAKVSQYSCRWIFLSCFPPKRQVCSRQGLQATQWHCRSSAVHFWVQVCCGSLYPQHISWYRHASSSSHITAVAVLWHHAKRWVLVVFFCCCWWCFFPVPKNKFILLFHHIHPGLIIHTTSLGIMKPPRSQINPWEIWGKSHYLEYLPFKWGKHHKMHTFWNMR